MLHYVLESRNVDSFVDSPWVCFETIDKLLKRSYATGDFTKTSPRRKFQTYLSARDAVEAHLNQNRPEVVEQIRKDASHKPETKTKTVKKACENQNGKKQEKTSPPSDEEKVQKRRARRRV